MQPAKLAKVNKQSVLNHKRAATEVTDLSAYGTLSPEPSFKILAPSLAIPLNRISEDLSKQGLVVLDKSSSNISLKGRESPAIRGVLS